MEATQEIKIWKLFVFVAARYLFLFLIDSIVINTGIYVENITIVRKNRNCLFIQILILINKICTFTTNL